MTVSVLSIPASLRGRVFGSQGALPEHITVSGVAVFYLAGSCYFIYAISQSARWAARYADESNRRTRVGLWTAAVGLALLACVAVVRSVVVVLRWTGGDLPAAAGTADGFVPVGGLLFVCGVSYPAVVAKLTGLRIWLRHRRVYHDLRPLWTILHDAFPQDALDRPRGVWSERVSPRRLYRRYWRRVVEIRDGLVQISPHLADVGFSSARPAHEQVDKLREAVRRQRAHLLPRSSSAVLVAAPPSADPEADVAQLVELSRALVG
jgi:hypothetical protein